MGSNRLAECEAQPGSCELLCWCNLNMTSINPELQASSSASPVGYIRWLFFNLVVFPAWYWEEVSVKFILYHHLESPPTWGPNRGKQHDVGLPAFLNLILGALLHTSRTSLQGKGYRNRQRCPTGTNFNRKSQVSGGATDPENAQWSSTVRLLWLGSWQRSNWERQGSIQ